MAQPPTCSFATSRMPTSSEQRVESLIDGALYPPLTPNEAQLRRRTGPVSILVGGPPCQGNSDLNNKTRRNDPRNRLYARMARAAVVLCPTVVIVENVPRVANDHGRVVEITTAALEAAAYRVYSATLDLLTVGVPQKAEASCASRGRYPRRRTSSMPSEGDAISMCVQSGGR